MGTAAKKGPSLRHRILARLQRRITETGRHQPTEFYDGSPCWLYRGAKKNGYAIVTLGPRQQHELGLPRWTYAHRVSYALHTGQRVEGRHVLHGCNERACINPAHLRAGTAADNLGQAIVEGRAHQMIRGSDEDRARARLRKNAQRRARYRRDPARYKAAAHASYMRHRAARCENARRYRSRVRNG